MQKASVRQVEKARIIPLVSPQEDRPNPQRDPRGLRQLDFVDGHVAAPVPWTPSGGLDAESLDPRHQPAGSAEKIVDYTEKKRSKSIQTETRVLH